MKISSVVITLAIGLLMVLGGSFLMAGPEVVVPREEVENNNQMNDLKIEDVVVGGGVEAKSGSHVYVDYIGTLEDGTKFDSSYDRGVPIDFVLGSGRVIPGWEKGIEGMRVGGTRKLVIPPSMAYGESGIGGVIPPNATLLFEVKLVDIK